jgi:hypothetical protein
MLVIFDWARSSNHNAAIVEGGGRRRRRRRRRRIEMRLTISRGPYEYGASFWRYALLTSDINIEDGQRKFWESWATPGVWWPRVHANQQQPWSKAR